VGCHEKGDFMFLRSRQSLVSPTGRHPARSVFKTLLAGALTPIILGLTSLSALAGDPFRPNDPHDIGDASEAAFEAFFYEGDYVEAQQRVESALAAEPEEPMNYAMAAALGYLNNDLSQLEDRAQQTKAAAEALIETDPLRGHLYSAVGIFLEGAYILQTQGIARGTPTALRMLQQVFNELKAAEQIDPTDPELSLLKGFMDLLLAVNLPFANPDQAIARLQNGYPAYLSHRGIAIGLRDLERYDEALVEVNQAIEAAPNNPDLFYLKAQILRLQSNQEGSLEMFDAALAYASQLPETTVRQIRFEACLTEGKEGELCYEQSGLGDS
jgi:tetratricopeptide (TPR) repeat protein